jgi:hypothetical protein
MRSRSASAGPASPNPKNSLLRSRSLGQQIHELELATRPTSRVVDLALALRRRKTGEILLGAGGRWDRIERRFLPGPPERAWFIDLEESQVEFTRWFATFLRDLRQGRPRDISLALAAGDRRGGKTFDLLLCTIALLIDVPQIDGSATVGWVVSANYQERDEIDKTIREYIPSSWYTHRKAPHFLYTFLHGASLRNVSADDPETLKRGRVDVVLYNEAQKLPIAALTNGIYGTADKGGIALLAANPPRRQVGEWVLELKKAIDAKRVTGAKYFGFSSKDNTRIDQAARERVGGIVRLLDPRAAQAEDEGAWLPVGDRAYPRFDPRPVEEGGMVGRPPEAGDIMSEVLRGAGIYTAYQLVAGADFQGRPHQAAVVLRVFGGRPDGKPVYWIIDEMIVEGTERHLSAEAFSRDYKPETLCWIPDATGEFQDARHSRRETSFDILRADRWNVYPPNEVQRPESQAAINPRVERRLALMYQVMDEGRFFVSSNCLWAIEALEKCPLRPARYGGKKPFGKYAHVTDSIGYPIWRLEPKAQLHHGPPDPRSMIAIDLRRHRENVWMYSGR